VEEIEESGEKEEDEPEPENEEDLLVQHADHQHALHRVGVHCP